MDKAENELLTRVGPGTPCGEMLRRYWWPIAVSDHVTAAPQKARLLGEDFVLFRLPDGRPGLLDLQCAHRSASLEYGRVEANGIRCPYHGWLYDPEGRCLDQPCEPADSTYKTKIRQRSWPVRDVSGFVFAYIGPQPVPEFPKYDLLFDDAYDKTVQGRDLHSNWLQRAENMLDALHVMVLHASIYPELALKRPDRCDYNETWYGVEMELDYPNGVKDKHHYFYPAGNRLELARAGQKAHQFIQWVVPMDDHESLVFQMFASKADAGKGSVTAAQYQKTVRGQYKRVEDGWWNIWERDQDDAITDSQGIIADRSKEHLATCDIGIVKMRRMLKAAIESVQRGEEPIGIVRKGDGHDGLIELESYKTLAPRAGEIRLPELGQKLEVTAPYDLE
jgi:phenylpropionate dioxygenase-like ring-hydroxylating dioxygenase large terminal subunit